MNVITKRDRNERGLTNTSWLKSLHTFSFGHFQNSNHMGFGPLRVINEDWVTPDAGFETHFHSNMEIITYVISGELTHKDNIGNGSSIRPGDIQIMSAGTGISHSERNGSDREEVHLLQIWIMPNVENQKPDYQQKTFDPEESRNRFQVVISPDGANGSLLIKQNALMLTGHFDLGEAIKIDAHRDRRYFLQVVRGAIKINAEKMSAGDGLRIESEDEILGVAIKDSEVLLFDLP